MKIFKNNPLLIDDIVLISIMAVLAACGLIYEYLLSHYAGRILGVVESTIYTMIGLMIVSMGLGSFTAKVFKDPFTAFAWLESLIALCGVSCILIIAASVSLGTLLPHAVAEVFNLPPDLRPKGGFFAALRVLSYYTPYFFGTLIGFLIGMEIPLIARVRESIYGQHLEHNTGTIYGADYIGAGAGAAVWVLVMLSLDITKAAVLTAIVNLVAGLVFLYRYRRQIKSVGKLLCMHALVAVIAVFVYQYGDDWSNNMTNMLFEDEVVFNGASHYQNFTITERHISNQTEPIYSFYINGRLQFSSEDEHIYHSMLVYPAMSLAPKNANVLIIGGGDGLALRDVLTFSPRHVTLVDLDAELIDLFTPSTGVVEPAYKQFFVKLNHQSFADKRVEVINADAFIQLNEFFKQNRHFDSIIVDLPDPSHPDLNRLYSDDFYMRLNKLLSAEGILVVQSTSPYHAKNAFISIGKTVEAAGFSSVSQYKQNIPSFGEWGWTIATKQPYGIRQRLIALEQLEPAHRWLTRDLLVASFEFPARFYADKADIEINHIGTHRVYRYHDQAWRGDLGIYRD